MTLKPKTEVNACTRTDTDTHRHRHTDTHRHTQTQAHTDTQTHTVIHSHAQSYTVAHENGPDGLHRALKSWNHQDVKAIPTQGPYALVGQDGDI